MLLKAGAEAGARDTYGTTPLHLACRHSRTGVSKLLLDKGTDVNVQNMAGSTPLHEAAMIGDWPLVRVLLARGANPNTTNRRKLTPLDVANAHHRVDVVNVLRNEQPVAKNQ